MITSPDLSAFTSRLSLRGQLGFDSALRIGAARSTQVDEPDLPILRDAQDRPYIPGSSLKGVLRSYVESVLRTLQANETLSDRNLACLSVGKPATRSNGETEPHVCLTQAEVDALKKTAPKNWHESSSLSPELKRRLPAPAVLSNLLAVNSPEAVLDRVLRDLSCWTCRVFGAQWLASKFLVRDLPLHEDLPWPAEIRDGVAIDRDAGRAAGQMKYQFEVLSAGTSFDLLMVIDNAAPAELGLVWLGLSAFERGEVPIGGGRSRGLGWCRLAVEWKQSRYVDTSNLLDALFAPERLQSSAATLASQPSNWVKLFGKAIGALPAQG